MRQEPTPAGPDNAPGPPPEELKPWYYQYWFLYPTIIFWPLWSVLIIRSPWHNGLVSGALAWAMLFVGSYLVYRGLDGPAAVGKLAAGDPAAIFTMQLIAPGLLLTVITQVHWQRNRRRIMAAAREAERKPQPGNRPPDTAPAPHSRRRNRRRRRRN